MMPHVSNNPTELMMEKSVSSHRLIFIFMGKYNSEGYMLLAKLHSQRVKQNRIQIGVYTNLQYFLKL